MGEKSKKKITSRQNSLIVGGLLGDMHIQKNETSIGGSCRLRFSQNAKQLDYLNWKYDAFKNDFCQNIRGVTADKRSRKEGTYTSYVFATERRSEFKDAHAKWYSPVTTISKGVTKTSYVKIIPSDLDKILTDPLALAVWYLDDGTKRSGTQSCRLATQSFSKEGNEIIQACLLKNFGIPSKIESWGRNKNNQVSYQIAILSGKRGGGYDKFRALLCPIVAAEVPSMLYKLQ